MPRPPPPGFFLRDDEEVLLRAGAAPGHAWALLLKGLVPVLGLAALAVALPLVLPRVADALAWSGAAILAVGGLVAWLVARARQRAVEYVVTDRRVYARAGRLITRLHLTTHDRITDLRYRQGPLDRRLGVESLSVMTSGGDVAMEGLADARAVRETIERAREALVTRLLERAGRDSAPAPSAATAEAEAAIPAGAADAGVAAPAARAAEPLPDLPALPSPPFVNAGDRTHWLAKPLGRASLAGARSAIGAAPIVAFVYVTRGPGAAASVLVLLGGVALMMVGVRVAQLRRAQYAATDRRVYARTGLLGTTVAQLSYDKITDITYKQDVLGRLLGYGSLTLTTAGGGAPIHLQGLREPLAAKEAIEGLRERYLRGARA